MVYLYDRTLYKLYLKEINVLYKVTFFVNLVTCYFIFFILLLHINQMESDVQ